MFRCQKRFSRICEFRFHLCLHTCEKWMNLVTKAHALQITSWARIRIGAMEMGLYSRDSKRESGAWESMRDRRCLRGDVRGLCLGVCGSGFSRSFDKLTSKKSTIESGNLSRVGTIRQIGSLVRFVSRRYKSGNYFRKLPNCQLERSVLTEEIKQRTRRDVIKKSCWQCRATNR